MEASCSLQGGRREISEWIMYLETEEAYRPYISPVEGWHTLRFQVSIQGAVLRLVVVFLKDQGCTGTHFPTACKHSYINIQVVDVPQHTHALPSCPCTATARVPDPATDRSFSPSRFTPLDGGCHGLLHR
jgi:hypothetical protein